jgi:hypothetical protein
MGRVTAGPARAQNGGVSGIRQLLYVSRATAGIGKPDIDQILASARRSNWRHDVTGCLLFSGRCFAQVLEGDGAHVEEAVARIAVDRRHTGMTILVDREVAARQHASWSMGYVYNLDLADRIEALLLAGAAAEADAIELVAKLAADVVMGPL